MSGKPHQTASNARTALPYVRACHGGTEAAFKTDSALRLCRYISHHAAEEMEGGQ